MAKFTYSAIQRKRNGKQNSSTRAHAIRRKKLASPTPTGRRARTHAA